MSATDEPCFVNEIALLSAKTISSKFVNVVAYSITNSFAKLAGNCFSSIFLDIKFSSFERSTKIKIGESEELALAPLGVLPEYQRQGIGSKLITEGHRIAKKLGYHYSIVLGSENYYPKFGYVPAIEYGIEAPFDVPSKNFMAIKLNESNVEIKGIVKYAKEFGI